MQRFSPKAIERLKSYVYLYIDPRTDTPFYVGKGKGNRAFTHLKRTDDHEISHRLAELRELKLAPRIELLKHGLSEREALLVESTAIDLISVGSLTNTVKGHGLDFGTRGRVEDIEAQLTAHPVDVTDPCLLININRAFRYGMSTMDLYDATRSAWKLSARRERVRYALSVYRGIVREVYAVAGWTPGGTTMRLRDEDGRSPARTDRWEFYGTVAEDPVRTRYLGRSVAHEFPKGNQNPVKYAGVPDGNGDD